MGEFHVGQLVFYDPRTAEQRANIMSTADYQKIGCRILAIDGETARLESVAPGQFFDAVPLEQLTPQAG